MILDNRMGYEVQDSVFHGEFVEIDQQNVLVSMQKILAHNGLLFLYMIRLHIGCRPCVTRYANVVLVLATSCCAHSFAHKGYTVIPLLHVVYF